ncbi:ABA4-like family protein [Paragemmobacter aquarius]|uniref:ABA4-like family protein n=1 Tax=Paragemmobacter aquarius TaxID=2169400 RepID=UPI001C1F3477|nr:ABA4-like family protein [Gemmobacter aquarius]
MVAGSVVPLLLAVAYAGLILGHWADAEGGFGSLADVAKLFANPWLLLAGWLHYLCFDLLVGAWIVRRALAEGVAHGFVVPCLALTFLFGPVGFLLFSMVRISLARVTGPRERMKG